MIDKHKAVYNYEVEGLSRKISVGYIQVCGCNVENMKKFNEHEYRTFARPVNIKQQNKMLSFLFCHLSKTNLMI